MLAHLKLPPRSAETLGLAVQGLTDKEIGRRLGNTITPRTVRDHLRPCIKRLEAHRKSELAIATFALFRRLHGNF